MGRKIILVLILLLIAGGIFFMFPESEFSTGGNDYQPLFEIMDNAGAAVTGGELHYWASLPQKDSRENYTLPELESLADELIAKLGCAAEQRENERIPSGGAAHRAVQREGQFLNGAKMKLFFQPLEGEGGETIHFFLIIDGGEPRSLAELAARAPALLDGRMVGSTLSFCLMGEMEKEMEPREMERFANLLIQGIGGKRGEGIRDGQMVSVTGYYPRLGDYFQAGRERLNLNIALRRNDLHGGTCIWAATPLISGWY